MWTHALFPESASARLCHPAHVSSAGSAYPTPRVHTTLGASMDTQVITLCQLGTFEGPLSHLMAHMRRLTGGWTSRVAARPMAQAGTTGAGRVSSPHLAAPRWSCAGVGRHDYSASVSARHTHSGHASNDLPPIPQRSCTSGELVLRAEVQELR